MSREDSSVAEVELFLHLVALFLYSLTVLWLLDLEF